MSYGLSIIGFLRKPISVIQQEISDQLKALIDAGLDTSATKILGQIIGVFSNQLDEVWELALVDYRSRFPDSATGDALDHLSALTKTYRLEAQSSKVTLDYLYLDDGVVLPAGQIVSVGSTGFRFVTTESISNLTGAPGTFSTLAISEDTGIIQGNAHTIDTIETPIVGWSAATALTCDNSEPYSLSNGQTIIIKINNNVEQIVTFVTGDFVDISNATALEVASVLDNYLIGAGAIEANGKVRIVNDLEDSGNFIEVVGGSANTVLGFSLDLIKGFNSEDAELGRNLETDSELRLRREEELRGLGSSAFEAIRSRLLLVEDVIQAFVFHNPLDIVDINGLPPHSFECVVSGGLNNNIAKTIFDSAPVGIESYGSVTEIIEDSQGFSQTIKFSRPTEIEIYIDLTVSINAGDFPLDGIDQIKTALVNEGDLLLVGEDIIALKFKAIALDVTGVIDVTSFTIDTITPPVGITNIIIDVRELAKFDTSRINVSTI